MNIGTISVFFKDGSDNAPTVEIHDQRTRGCKGFCLSIKGPDKGIYPSVDLYLTYNQIQTLLYRLRNQLAEYKED